MQRPNIKKYEKPVKLSEFPTATCYEAGHLVTKNAGWRRIRPVVDKTKCVGCFKCYMYCPDGTIFKEDGKIAIDYDFCKGCGICAKSCLVQAITMEEEKWQ